MSYPIPPNLTVVSELQLMQLLSGARTANSIVIRGLDLTGIVFSAVDFADVHFDNCKLSSCHMRRSVFQSCSFNNCEMTCCDFTGSDLRGSVFYDSPMNGVDLTLAMIQGALFSNCSLQAACLSSTELGAFTLLVPAGTGNLQFANSTQTRFTDVKFHTALLVNVDFQNIDMRKVEGLDQAIIVHCPFESTLLPLRQEEPRLGMERLADAVFGYNNSVIKALDALSATGQIQYLVRINPPLSPLRFPRLPFPVSQLLRAFDESSYRESIRAYYSWAYHALDTLSSLKRAYRHQDNYHMTSLLAYREKHLDMRRTWIEFIDSCVDLATFALSATVAPLLLACLVLFLVWRGVTQIGKKQKVKSGEDSTFVASLRSISEGAQAFWLGVSEGAAKGIESPANQPFKLDYRLKQMKRYKSAVKSILGYANRGVGNAFVATCGFLLFMLAIMARALLETLSTNLFRFLRVLLSLLIKGFWYAVCGFGERPIRIVLTALFSVVLGAFAFLQLGLPVFIEGHKVSYYRLNYHLESGYSWGEFITGWREALTMSLHSFGSLGFYPLGDAEYSSINLLAGVLCIWGLFLSALFVWTLARRTAAY